MSKINTLVSSLLLFGLLSLSSVSFALESDKTKPITLNADHAKVDQLTGIGIYSGNVRVTQGSTVVTGDKIETHSGKNKKLNLVIVYGSKNKQASYETLIDSDKPKLIAKANTIKYYAQQHYVQLLGNASANQGTDSIKAPYLRYDTKAQLLISNNKKPEDKHASQKGRTTIVIMPNDLQKGTKKP